jgi:hypothetical protein
MQLNLSVIQDGKDLTFTQIHICNETLAGFPRQAKGKHTPKAGAKESRKEGDSVHSNLDMQQNCVLYPEKEGEKERNSIRLECRYATKFCISPKEEER